MTHQIKSYFRFLWHSKNEHGVHSPFVFALVTECFYDKKPKAEYSVLNNYRKALLDNKNTIEVTDFGAGSRVFKSNTRSINQIAKTAGITEKRAELLFRLSRYFEPENVLEIGTSLGLATSALSLGHPKASITTLEGCPETAKIAQQQFEKFSFQNVELINAEFETYLAEIKDRYAVRSKTAALQENFSPRELATDNRQPTTDNYQLIYFDGNHSKAATLNYFELLLPTITNDTVWVFDDIHWSSEMEEAWEIIKNHPKVTVTIDTFQWGLVFFRYEQQKEHFVIRI